jgi:hypothetical protein
MSITRSTNTVNIKPGNTNALNVVPRSVTTIGYAGYTTPGNLNYWGTHKWGQFKWGETPKSSVGQIMPAISTVEK